MEDNVDGKRLLNDPCEILDGRLKKLENMLEILLQINF